jgi:hypothetical protein
MSEKFKITIVKGVEGTAVYIADCRVCGPKPLGGGVITGEWDVDEKDIKYALAHAVKPSVQPQDMEKFCDSLCPFNANQEAK